MLRIRSILMATLFVTKILAGDEESEACINLMESENEDCCDSLKIFTPFEEAEDECTNKDSKDMNCDDFKCILNKKGLLKGDDLDEDAAKTFFSAIGDIYPEEQSVIKKMEAACYNNKYKEYESIDEKCPLLNFYVCAYVNTILECNSWKSTPVCKTLSEDAKVCKTQLEKELKE